MLAFCNYSLLKDENTDEVNCEADFLFQSFHQKCTKYKHIKLCAIPAIVVYLTFCQQVTHFFSIELLYNFYSVHIRQCNILSASHLILASHSITHTHTYLTRESLVCCSGVAQELLMSHSWVIQELFMSRLQVARGLLTNHLHATHRHLLPCGWAVP